jgi:flagellin
MRLATGKRINAAEDDSAGYAIARKLEAKTRGQAQALANIGDAKSMLTVAEGALGTVMDILQTMKEKTVQAANDTMGTDERAKIKNQLDALSAEVTDLLGDAEFNGTSLFSTTGNTALNFQVNAESGDTFTATINSTSVGALGITTTALKVTSHASAGATIAVVDNAIEGVSQRLAKLGDDQKRLTFKQENLTTSMNNYEAARSRIEDADFAKEQMNIVRLQILQQTGTASLAQANSAPQSILSIVGGQ